MKDRLAIAWRELLAIRTLPDDEFWAGYQEIETHTLDGLSDDERNAAIEALNAYVVQLGRGSGEGFV